MDAAGVEVLFTCDPSNMAWLTGYDGWSFYVHQGVIIGPLLVILPRVVGAGDGCGWRDQDVLHGCI